jgi:methylenetetrahydrofolate reductase (NADPH)
MHVSKKLEEARKANRVSFSFEFFPPKTAQGIQNLYDRTSATDMPFRLANGL